MNMLVSVHIIKHNLVKVLLLLYLEKLHFVSDGFYSYFINALLL